VLGVIEGIFIAVALALLDFIRRAWRPYDAVPGRVDDLKGYHDVSRHPRTQDAGEVSPRPSPRPNPMA
jgi:MFS superfamily sulfate permease-like transporter